MVEKLQIARKESENRNSKEEAEKTETCPNPAKKSKHSEKQPTPAERNELRSETMLAEAVPGAGPSELKGEVGAGGTTAIPADTPLDDVTETAMDEDDFPTIVDCGPGEDDV